ncbi:MAG TPA: ABC transporter substrate-binding protein [Candidatus Acidoferrales bacterium]|nr:ABC transporter substrate-binding protein [Candidatus Acidoferrales bacterium]
MNAVASLLLAVFILTACGGGVASAPATHELIIARVKDAVGLDPAHETDGLSLNIASEVLEGLVAFRPGTFDVIPALATQWKSSPDGKTWTFVLRPHVRFTDGTPADAAAVKFNFDRWRLPNDPYRGAYPYEYYESQFGGFPGLIVDVRAPNPRTVVFTLREPFGPFLRNLAMPSFAIGSPRAIKADAVAYSLQPVGTGPYEVSEWVKDDHITLTANPDWRPKPAYDTVIVRDIPDQATSVLSLEKGDIDGLTDPRPDDATALAAQPGITIYEQPSNNVSYLALNLERKPFGDVRVRRAIAYAVDVRAIVHGLYSKGAVVAGNWTPPGMLGEDPRLQPYPHDVARAKALLAEAGFPHGFSTELYYGTAPRPYMPEPQRVAEAIAADLHDAGIEVTLEPFEWGVYLQKIRNGEHPMCLIGWIGDNGDPDNFMYDLLDQDSAIKGSAQNYSFWRDPTFHKLMLAGQTTIGRAARNAIYMQANDLIHDQVPAVSIVHTTVPLAMKSSIGGVIARPDSILNFELMKPKATP